ncbi:O-antigen ligase family protein [Paracraurococcus lichenis]|uniref:O-antigen ligase family protein n=1 Tax=Paracraurococcus lichenis TaxID=3064888 RepID=A0ABT9DVI8_9PROT|nr:O-antigen ligase family protein [Paracraurococcus sp. LOR1-02]MDO9707904.1 O-antigen ligase family protein [Paracraurococcus sp. LOR1-02]
MNIALSPATQRMMALLGAATLLLGAVLMPMKMMLLVPALVLGLLLLALYQFPRALAVLLVMTCALALDFQMDVTLNTGIGAVLVKSVPFGIAAVLLLRYGPSREINWPFLTFTAIAGLSLAILPIGHVATNEDMLRSYIGSAAPFVLGFAVAPRRFWTLLIRGAALVPIISAVCSVPAMAIGFWTPFDIGGRFQGMHSPPFLAGFCVTAIFACLLEYLRGFRALWLVVAGLDLAILMLTQARAPLISVLLFLGLVFLLSGREIMPLRRKVDLVMGGVLPGLILLSPAIWYAMNRIRDMANDMSGRDIIWPYFLDAIEARPLFGFGLGAGKLIVNPEDPTIRLLGSSAAHNEYLRLSVDAGILGCAAIFLSIAAWVWIGSRRCPSSDRLVLRAALAAALLHSGFDNTLIASTALMQFSFFAAAMARGQADLRETSSRRSRRRHESRLEEGAMSAVLARQGRW